MNGSNGQSQNVQINPLEAAQFALIFLGRATFTRNERQMFDVADALLNAIVSGKVQITQPQSAGNELPPPQQPEALQ
jgi:hypothetical protein